MKILILGGTVEGRTLAHEIAHTHPTIDFITSLAGATTSTPNVAGDVRIGGFGGTDGLSTYLKEQNIDALIDATHPFATTITDHAVKACSHVGIDYLRLERPQWIVPTEADVVFVPDAAEAARLVARTSSSAFLTIGRKDLSEFQGLGKTKLLVRAIEAPDENIRLDNATFVTARPPFALKDEIALMQEHQIDTLISKASGGEGTRAKLDAAAKIGARIILLRRPPPPDGERVFSVDEALAWILKK